MTTVFALPDLGEGMEEAEIVAWLVQVGDVVVLDQPFVEVQTDKAVVEMPSPVAGVVAVLHAAVGDTVHVGSPLIEFEREPSSPAPPSAPPALGDAGSPHVSDSASPKVSSASSVAPVAGRAGRVKASPAVRRLAVELDVDLESVAGTGDGGRVLAQDVTDAVARSATGRSHDVAPRRFEEGAPRATSGTVVPLRGIQRRMAQVMTESLSIPHITGMDEFDATNLVAAREQVQNTRGDGPSVTLLAFFLKAAALTLRRHPMLNATLNLDADELILHADVNIGIAVASPTGLIVPVVRNVDELSLRQISFEVARLTGLATEGRLTPADLKDGTFTITNYGALGRGRFATPIIRPGEVAILGFGAMVKRPWVVDDDIAVRPVLPWSFSADHRVIDGQLSGSFQKDVIARLANPHLMLLDA